MSHWFGHWKDCRFRYTYFFLTFVGTAIFVVVVRTNYHSWGFGSFFLGAFLAILGALIMNLIIDWLLDSDTENEKKKKDEIEKKIDEMEQEIIEDRENALV